MSKHTGSMPYESKSSLISGIFRKRLAISIELGSINEDSTILDIGCFRGDLLKLIRTSNSSCKLYGVDRLEADWIYLKNCDFIISAYQKISE